MSPREHANFSTLDTLLRQMMEKIDHLDRRLQALERQRPLVEYLQKQANERFDRLEGHLSELREYAAALRETAADRRWLIGLTISVLGLGLALLKVVSSLP